MSITTMLLLGTGVAAGFVVGIYAAERGIVGSEDLTKLSKNAIDRIRSYQNRSSYD